MKQTELTIIENLPLCTDVYRMVLAGDTSAVTAPGQFVNLKLDGFFLRRPISVCDWDAGRLSIIYKVVGRGTAAMARLHPGTVLDTLTGLGNGYDLSLSGKHPLLVGGGVGVPPLYGLAKRLIAQGKRVTAVIGFEHADNILLADDFRALGASVILFRSTKFYNFPATENCNIAFQFLKGKIHIVPREFRVFFSYSSLRLDSCI